MKMQAFPIDKHRWCPSLLPGPIVLISTSSREKQPNLAPKSWVQMVSFEPPILMFSGTKGNTTETNILSTGCFGVNLVDSSMAAAVYRCIQWHGVERIEKSGFTLQSASQIETQVVGDSRAVLECRLHATSEVGSALVLFGEIVAASIRDEILTVDREDRYRLLDQVLFLESDLYATVGRPTSEETP